MSETATITKRFETCAEVRAWYAKHFYGMPVYEHGVEMTCASHGLSYSPPPITLPPVVHCHTGRVVALDYETAVELILKRHPEMSTIRVWRIHLEDTWEYFGMWGSEEDVGGPGLGN